MQNNVKSANPTRRRAEWGLTGTTPNNSTIINNKNNDDDNDHAKDKSPSMSPDSSKRNGGGGLGGGTQGVHYGQTFSGGAGGRTTPRARVKVGMPFAGYSRGGSGEGVGGGGGSSGVARGGGGVARGMSDGVAVATAALYRPPPGSHKLNAAYRPGSRWGLKQFV